MEDSYLKLKVVNNTLIFDTPVTDHGLLAGEKSYLAWPAEHVNSFLESYNIVPTYIDANNVYGVFDEVSGKWTGMMGHVQ